MSIHITINNQIEDVYNASLKYFNSNHFTILKTNPTYFILVKKVDKGEVDSFPGGILVPVKYAEITLTINLKQLSSNTSIIINVENIIPYYNKLRVDKGEIYSRFIVEDYFNYLIKGTNSDVLTSVYPLDYLNVQVKKERLAYISIIIFSLFISIAILILFNELFLPL